jgi:hypothetical protein
VKILIGKEGEAWVFPGTEQEEIRVNGTKDFVEIWDFFC